MKTVLLITSCLLFLPGISQGINDPELLQGKKVYDYYCYQCHGYAGDARTLAANYLRPPPRNFTATTPTVLSHEQMRHSIRHGRNGTAMVSFDNVLSSTQIDAVVAYIQTSFMTAQPVKRRYHTAENGWPDHERYQSAFGFVSGEIDIEMLEQDLSPEQQHGRQLFLSACVSCHDRINTENDSPVWEPRAVSYPRNPNLAHLAKSSQPDSISGATPYSKHEQEPVIKELSAVEQAGRILFQENCAFCHAADGTGKNWIGTFMQPPARDLTRSALILLGPDSAVITVIKNGLANTSMPAWKNILSDLETRQIIAYLRRAFASRDQAKTDLRSGKNTSPQATASPGWQAVTNTRANH